MTGSALSPFLIPATIGGQGPTFTAVPTNPAGQVTTPTPIHTRQILATGLPTNLSPLGCSTEGSTAVQITFRNNSSADLYVYWVDYGCSRVYYETIPAGESVQQGTYITHVWEFVNPSTGAIIKTHTVGKEGEVVDIP